jgi:Zn-dependent protease
MVLWWQTGNPFWAALARIGAVLNLLNLIPVWILDGGQAVLALSKGERITLLAACLLLWVILDEKMFFLVGLGAAYQIFFAGDLPPRPSRITTIYFVLILTALGIIIKLLPGQGLGIR